MTERFDVFLSYARRDRPEWVAALAENLHQRGFEVFLDDWEIGGGDVLVHELDRGILESRHGVLVLTRSYFERPYVRAEYAAILQRTIEGRQRVVPVLVDDVEVPPLLASRVWVDFRGAEGPAYDAKLEELARALRGQRARDRPARTGVPVAPPAARYRPEGALRRTLRIGADRVSLLADGEEEAGHAPMALDHRLEERVHALARTRERRLAPGGETPLRSGVEAAAVAGAPLHEASLAVGAALARTFLAGAAGVALRDAVRRAEGAGASLELGLEVADERLRGLPWETLRLPEADGTGGADGDPLALHPRVHLFRAAAADGPTPAISIPGPLRILVAIASPEAGGGELLDYEKELARILDAVEPARRLGKAHVQILHRGTVAAIREALEAERFHVLHLSCHAGPGVLVLETEEGDADEVSADRLWREALPPDRGVPLVVLAGCATALEVRRARTELERGEGEEVLPGLAAALLEHGVPAVLAMQAPVSDRYATDLAGRLYGALATQAEPAPLAALARARLEAEGSRRGLEPGAPDFHLAEWATPALYLRGAPQRLYDPAAPFAEIGVAPEPRFAEGIVVRRVGEFVGRRREERLIVKTLRGEGNAGALVRGIGGVGKSTLAAEVLTRLMGQGHFVVSVYGETAPEPILEEVGRELLSVAHSAGLPEDHPLRQVAIVLRRPDAEWTDRFDLLERSVLDRLPLILLLDNFEDNLAAPEAAAGAHTVHSRPLADFLARWLARPGRSRVLVTCRHPFVLPGKAHRHLDEHHLGPLSFAETRKLFWRLPALEALSPDDRLRAYRDVGGHPRALEYLDALLRGGEARFRDVGIRLETALEQRGIGDARAWIGDRVGGALDRALAETVTLAAADVLLGDLLKLLDPSPLARRLLVGASVYRVPVDETALAWQVGEEVEPEPDREGDALRRRANERIAELKARGEQPTRENLGFTDAELRAYAEARERAVRPPIRTPGGTADARHLLERLGLLSRIPAGEAAAFQVHRWTAAALERETAPERIQDAHCRAARFWRWRVAKVPQSRQTAIDQLLEARYHHHASGDIEQAVEVTGWICSQLDTWGAYGREEQLCREVLEWVPDRSREAAAFLHQLGMVAQQRGSYEEALEWYRKALAIAEELGNRAGMAGSYHQLGNVSYLRGSYEEALDWYRKSLAIREELGNRAGMANSYHQLGIVAQARGSY
jgi:tetratricopeptide (TPR) repeat protein